jgi:hypothetical protein
MILCIVRFQLGATRVLTFVTHHTVTSVTVTDEQITSVSFIAWYR